MCEGETCVGGDNLNYVYGNCTTGFGCSAKGGNWGSDGYCTAMSGKNTTWLDGCYGYSTCTDLEISQDCGSNVTVMQYVNGTFTNQTIGTGSCLASEAHCDVDLVKKNGYCKKGSGEDSKIIGAILVGGLLLLLVCCCGCCACHSHHKKVKEKQALEEALVANEAAQATEQAEVTEAAE